MYFIVIVITTKVVLSNMLLRLMLESEQDTTVLGSNTALPHLNLVSAYLTIIVEGSDLYLRSQRAAAAEGPLWRRWGCF